MRFKPPFLVAILIACGFLPTVFGQQPHSVILRSGAVASDPTLPKVHVTADQQRVPLGTLVNFTLSPATVANDRRYVVTLVFGDGQKQVMRTPETVHLYQAIGTYTYSVSVTQGQFPTGSSNFKVPSVIFNASPGAAREGELVKFTATPSGPYPNLQYRFVYGDGSASNWQSENYSQHVYQKAGDFFAYVDIGDGQQRLGGSARKQISISSTRPLTVSMTATQSARAGKAVSFIARAFPPGANTKYQFTFGDGQQTPWQVNPQAQHIYKTGGSYSAYVQANQSGAPNSTAKSNPTLVNVQPAAGPTPDASPRPTPNTNPSPTPTPDASPSPNESPSPNGSPSGSPTPNTLGPASTSPSDPSTSTSTDNGNQSNGNQTNRGVVSTIKWWYWLLAALLLFLLFKATGYLFVAKPTFAAFSDPGAAEISDKKGLLPLDFQLVMNPNVSSGDYSVTSEAPQLITNTDRLENRQMLEI